MNNESATEQPADIGLQLTVSEDKLEVILDAPAEHVSGEEIILKVQQLLKSKNIQAEMDIETLRSAVDKARQDGSGIDSLVIARGQPPKPPCDARVEWARDFFAEGYVTDSESGTVDFHEMASQPYVDKDELLAKIIPAQPGVGGTDVYGHPIKVGSPKQAHLTKGPNVYWDEAEQGFRASIPGRVKLTGAVLDVDQVYSIKSDVGPETGNVKHPGAVIISGDVISEFRVEAGGPVEVKGQIYASDMTCEGDLTVRYGINSSPGKTVSVGGALRTKHISNAHIICHGDVLADAEIYNSTLNVRGHVICRGRIVGGSTVSLEGIRTGQTGSETEIKTILVAGVDFELMEAVKAKKEELENLTKELEKTERAHKQLEMLGNKLLPGQAEQRKEMESFISASRERINSLKAEKNEIYRKMTEGRAARITIDKVAYPGTTLRIFSSTLEVDEIQRGPLVAGYDAETGTVILSSRR